jgi:hypothetical protein
MLNNMGLNIESPNYNYHWGYGRLHLIRYAAYLICDGKKDIEHFENSPYDWSYIISTHRFPNLMMHSDCEGRYSKNGKIDLKTLEDGNSIELLKELKEIKNKHLFDSGKIKKIGADEVFKDFYIVVKDCVKNKVDIVFE